MTDFVVIGGGIAGVSAAAHLAPHGSVALLEAEGSLAFHTTGRSAAVYVVNYGALASRPLAAASRKFLENPPGDVSDAPLLTERGVLWIADQSQVARLEAAASATATSPGSDTALITAGQATEMVPVLRPDRVAAGMIEAGARDIDVAGLHQTFVRMARRYHTTIRTDAPVTGLVREGSGWKVTAGGETFNAGAVVNASGAWGDVVADMAGVAPVGLQPRRRTAFMVPGSETHSSWPFVIDTDHNFYFKPDGPQLLCSLGEEEPAEPGDPRPRMEDVALAIERINDVTTLEIRTVNSQWVGLRTFAPDGNLVIGEEPESPGFYWLVGQGGIGIATAPAYGSLLASLVTGDAIDPALVESRVEPELLSPARFRA